MVKTADDEMVTQRQLLLPDTLKHAANVRGRVRPSAYLNELHTTALAAMFGRPIACFSLEKRGWLTNPLLSRPPE